MQFTADMRSFKRALSLVSKAVPGKSTLPILSTTRIVAHKKSVVIEGTNLEVAMRVKLDGADVAIDTPGEVNLNMKALLGAIKGTGSGMLKREGDVVYIAVENNTVTMSPFVDPDDDWPTLPKIKTTESINLKDAMSRCAGFQSTEDTRHFLNSVCVDSDGETTHVVATNGRILKAIRLTHAIAAGQYIIPTCAIKKLTSKPFPDKLWGMGHTDNQVVFRSGDIEFITRRIDAEYPDYKSVVGGVVKDVSITLNRGELMEAIAEVGSVMPAKLPRVKLETCPDGLCVSAEWEDVKSATNIHATASGSMLTYINIQLLHACLDSIVADDVTLSTSADGLGSISIESEADEDTICMPMRGD